MAQQKRIYLGIMRLRVRSLASLSGSRIWRCLELWCRLQMQLRPGIAVAVVQAGSYNCDSTPSLRTSICYRCGPKKTKKKKEEEEGRKHSQIILSDAHNLDTKYRETIGFLILHHKAGPFQHLACGHLEKKRLTILRCGREDLVVRRDDGFYNHKLANFIKAT